jgi:hypothetical protein
MEAKMDGKKKIPWKEPKIKNRVDFLKKMQNMSTPENFTRNLDEKIDGEKLDIDDYQKIANFREQGNLSGAFFLARQLAAEGDAKGKILVKEIMEDMDNGN